MDLEELPERFGPDVAIRVAERIEMIAQELRNHRIPDRELVTKEQRYGAVIDDIVALIFDANAKAIRSAETPDKQQSPNVGGKRKRGSRSRRKRRHGPT